MTGCWICDPDNPDLIHSDPCEKCEDEFWDWAGDLMYLADDDLVESEAGE